jgi:hypothetical protein
MRTQIVNDNTAGASLFSYLAPGIALALCA